MEIFSNWAVKEWNIKKLITLVDEDTNAFNKIIEAFRMPKTIKKIKIKGNKLYKMQQNAIEVPLSIMKISFKSMDIMKKMAQIGNPNSISDAGVGALCARTAVIGGYLNVKINCKDCEDKAFVKKITQECNSILRKTKKLEKEIISLTEKSISKK